jgi:hypothetical protein
MNSNHECQLIGLSDAVADEVSGAWRLLSNEATHHFFALRTKPSWPDIVAISDTKKYPNITVSVSYLGTDTIEVSRATRALGFCYLGLMSLLPMCSGVNPGDRRVRGCAGRGGGAGGPSGRGPG